MTLTGQHVLASLKGPLESGRYFDLKITCGSDSYNVHKVIVCEQVDFFARAIKFGGKESSEGTIDLPVEEAAAIKLLIQYLYEGDYDPQLPDKRCGLLTNRQRPNSSASGQIYSYDFPHICPRDGVRHYVCPHHTCCRSNCNFRCKRFVCETCDAQLTGDSSQLLLHTEMYDIADKYQAASLKDLAAEKFHRACRRFWKEPNFATIARHVCATMPHRYEDLCDGVARAIFEHIDVLIKKPGIEALLNEYGALSCKVLKLNMDAHQEN